VRTSNCVGGGRRAAATKDWFGLVWFDKVAFSDIVNPTVAEQIFQREEEQVRRTLGIAAFFNSLFPAPPSSQTFLGKHYS
jgi:hypothetical protein